MISAKIIRKRNRKEGICQWRRKFPQEISTQIVNEMMMMMTCKESSTWRSKKLLLKHFIHCSRAMLLEMEKYMYAISKMNFNREREWKKERRLFREKRADNCSCLSSCIGLEYNSHSILNNSSTKTFCCSFFQQHNTRKTTQTADHFWTLLIILVKCFIPSSHSAVLSLWAYCMLMNESTTTRLN